MADKEIDRAVIDALRAYNRVHQAEDAVDDARERLSEIVRLLTDEQFNQYASITSNLEHSLQPASPHNFNVKQL
jgi:hypothetical protein